MELITSRANDNVKLYRRLSSSRRARSDKRLFPLEGIRIISDAYHEKAEIERLFLSESFVSRNKDISDEISASAKRSYLVSDDTAKYMSSTEETQGILALCRMKEDRDISQIVHRGGIYVMLSGLQDPGNMGTIIRTADAVGIGGIICCGCCDIYNPKTLRAAMGSIMRMPFGICSREEAFECFAENGIRTYASVIDSDAVSVSECAFGDGSAVLIGNEGSGLSEDDVMRCDERITIRMHGSIDSLNAAMAAGIIMWEMSKRHTAG
ncbi:MAG: RNA methyltransferase [Oscillospiraceae bacterium]|nr:RNA methyltransferase [Oscillospiraceae bacterium]